jgi:hypothetical protein
VLTPRNISPVCKFLPISIIPFVIPLAILKPPAEFIASTPNVYILLINDESLPEPMYMFETFKSLLPILITPDVLFTKRFISSVVDNASIEFDKIPELNLSNAVAVSEKKKKKLAHKKRVDTSARG